MTAPALSTAAVAKVAGLSRRRLNEWVRAGVAVPERPSAKQGSGARWSRAEAEILRLLVRARRLTSLEGLLEAARALRRAPPGAAVLSRTNGAVRAAQARLWGELAEADAALVLVRKAGGTRPS